jgi:hypothetical protein
MNALYYGDNLSVLRESKAFASAHTGHDAIVVRVWGRNDIVSKRLKSLDGCAGKILVGEKAHIRRRSGILSPSSTYRAHRRDTR